ncbi:MAG: serine/threonine-protein kinase [Gemmatimonadota bacterium]|nr:serine/threonine-protein kinase [Gemmatimonadota bacterium]
MTAPIPSTHAPIAPSVDAAALQREAEHVFAGMFELEQLVAANEFRALFVARHVVLERRVALRVHFEPDTPGRRWFERETVLLAQLDHPGLRPIHSAGYRGDWAYRVTKWIDGESLYEAIQRGPRPIPDVLQLARDLLSALDYAHTQQIVVRRIAPTSLMLTRAGRAIITDLRWANSLLEYAGPEVDPATDPFLAPETRNGDPGDPGSDLYAAAALIYYAVTGEAPAADPADISPPSLLRTACPKALERVVVHALQPMGRARYLNAAEMAGDLLSELGDLAFRTSAAPLTAESDPTAWEKLLRRALGDDYELLSELGAGAFGRVYRVRDLALEREVALKVLHPSLTADPGVVERFRREAQLAAQVRHPHIVDVFDTGGRTGLLWYTMAFIPGENLGQYVRRHGPLSIPQAVELLRQGLSALTHAHGQGLVHRDLKPENILLERPDWRIQITDFGLALALEGLRDDRKHYSHSGTPEFAAPEQLLGEMVDNRADLYSLTMVAIFGLMGRLPFGGGTIESVLARQALGEVPNVRAHRADVPEELARVLTRAAARDPDERFESAEAYAEALERALRRWRFNPRRLVRRLLGRD